MEVKTTIRKEWNAFKIKILELNKLSNRLNNNDRLEYEKYFGRII